MRIVIDMQGAQTPFSRHRGVGRYTINMVKALLPICETKHEVFLVLNGAFADTIEPLRAEFSELLPATHIKSWQQYSNPVSGCSGNNCGRQAAELIREWYIEQLQPDIIWSTNLQEGWADDAVTSVKKLNSMALYCSTLHDVIPLLFPKKYLATDIKYWYHDKISYVKQSDIILTDSNYSKQKIIELLEVDNNRIFVTGCGYDKAIFRPINNIEFEDKKLKILDSSSFILYTGGADEYKNLSRLMLAYSLLPNKLKESTKLVFAGYDIKAKENQLAEYAKTIHLDCHQLIFTGYVSDNDLAGLYNKCSLFVFPSLSEGFGIPPLEAMACGCPVIAANTASLPEIIGFNDALFNPYDEYDISSKIKSALTDEHYREKLVASSKVMVDNFSWEKSAKIVLEIFENFYKGKEHKCTDSHSQLVERASTNYNQLINRIAKISKKSEQTLIQLAQAIADSELSTSSDHSIYLDISSLVITDLATGIQRVVSAICSELKKLKIRNYKVVPVFSYPQNQHTYLPIEVNGKYCVPNEEIRNNYRVDFHDGDVLLFLDLQPGSESTKRGNTGKLRNMGVKVYFIVYDLIPIYYPHYFDNWLYQGFNNWLKEVLYSDGAICISLDVANKLRKWINDGNYDYGQLFKINYFHLGADIRTVGKSKGLPNDSEFMLKKFNSNMTFLMVGTVEPRKGHKLILDAFDILWQSNVSPILVIVGKEGWMNSSTIEHIKNHLEYGKRIFWLEGISDEYLDKVYSVSKCLIAASEAEGFGLPLIEAAQHGLPIIARDIPVFREVAGEYAYYFADSNSPQDVADALKDWINLYAKEKYPKSDGMPWITWRESASQLIKIILPNCAYEDSYENGSQALLCKTHDNTLSTKVEE